MPESFAICTILTIAITVIVSYLGFHDHRILDDYLFNPDAVLCGRQYYRLFTAGLLHADWTHLLFNMFSLYSFARPIELFYGPRTFLLIYVVAILGGNLLALVLHRHHEYRALGASGGVCGIIFACIFLLPGGGVRFFLLPMSLPAWLYAILFLVVSYVGMRRGIGNIGHDAHLGGALIGLLVATAMYPHIIRQQPLLYASVVGLALLLFVVTWRWPLHLPGPGILDRERWREAWQDRRRRTEAGRAAADEQRLEELLEKISQSGVHSLSSSEKRELELISQRRERNRC